MIESAPVRTFDVALHWQSEHRYLYSSVDCKPTATIANAARKCSVERVDYTEHLSANYDESEYAISKFSLIELVYRYSSPHAMWFIKFKPYEPTCYHHQQQQTGHLPSFSS
jgi:hypothetical protein